MTQLIFGASLMLWLTVSHVAALSKGVFSTTRPCERKQTLTWKPQSFELEEITQERYANEVCHTAWYSNLLTIENVPLTTDPGKRCQGCMWSSQHFYCSCDTLFFLFVSHFFKKYIFHVLLQFMSIAWDFRSTHMHCYFYHKVTGNVHLIVSGCLISTQTLTLIRLKRRQIQMMLSLLLWRWQTVPSST